MTEFKAGQELTIKEVIEYISLYGEEGLQYWEYVGGTGLWVDCFHIHRSQGQCLFMQYRVAPNTDEDWETQ